MIFLFAIKVYKDYPGGKDFIHAPRKDKDFYTQMLTFLMRWLGILYKNLGI
jgi:hypothetical protein